MKKGQEIKVLILDRNVEESFEQDDKIKPNKIYKPKTFFNSCWAIYTHDKDLKGKIYYRWQEPIQEQKNKFNSKMKGGSTFKVDSTFKVEDRHDNSKPYDFEFEIEYKENHWYPLENGFLPGKKDIPSFIRGGLLDEKKKKWNKLPKNTKVGERGPMILWKDLDKLPNCYYLDFDKL